MNPFKLTLLFTMSSLLISAQTDDYNLKKYWKLRSAFVEDFVKIGSEQGESLPAGARKPCYCIDNDCDWEYGECFGEMHWG